MYSPLVIWFFSFPCPSYKYTCPHPSRSDHHNNSFPFSTSRSGFCDIHTFELSSISFCALPATLSATSTFTRRKSRLRLVKYNLSDVSATHRGLTRDNGVRFSRFSSCSSL